MLPNTKFHRIIHLKIIFLFILFTICQSNQHNCQQYNQAQPVPICLACYYGYQLNTEGECTPSTLLKISSLAMSIKYLEPIFMIKSILIEFHSQFWFLSQNSKYSAEKQSSFKTNLNYLIVSINQQRLWPFNINNLIGYLLGETFFNNFQRNIKINQSTKQKDIFRSQKIGFVPNCFFNLISSLLISISVFVLVRLINLSTNYFKIQSKQIKHNDESNKRIKIKGIFIVLFTNQFYQFVAFYGFYSIKNLNCTNFLTKIDSTIAVATSFTFLFISITIHPLMYSFNKKTIKLKKNNRIHHKKEFSNKSQKQQHLIRKILQFNNSVNGFYYFIFFKFFKQFIVGMIIGYFSQSSSHLILIMLIYAIQLYFQEIIQSICNNNGLYFRFRKIFLAVTIFYLYIQIEQSVQFFSISAQYLVKCKQLCICMLYAVSFLQTSTNLWIFSCRMFIFIKIKFNFDFPSNKIANVQAQNLPKNRVRVKKQPTIAQRMLKKLRTQKQIV